MNEAAQMAMQGSPWTPEMIAALFAGLEKLLMAIGALVVMLVGVYIQIRNSRKEGQKVGAVRDEKLDTVVTNTAATVGQLNGERTVLLEKIATLERLYAEASGRKADAIRATEAEKHAAVSSAAAEAVKPAVQQKSAAPGKDGEGDVK